MMWLRLRFLKCNTYTHQGTLCVYAIALWGACKNSRRVEEGVIFHGHVFLCTVTGKPRTIFADPY